MGDATDGGAGTTGDAGAGTTSSGTGATGTGTTGTQPGAGDGDKGSTTQPKTFTQEELDRIVGERVARATKPFADHDALREKAEQYDKLQEASKSELQKATDRAAESERKALQLEADMADSRLRSEVIATAATKGIVDPVDAFKLLDRSKVEFDKAGDPTNIGALLDDLIKAKPYLSGKPGNGSGEGGPRGGSKPEGMTANEWFQKAASGRQ